MANSVPVYSNRTTTVTLGATTDDTATINLAEGDGALFPSPGAEEFVPAVILNRSTGTYEEIDITSRTGDALTVVRARGGTTAVPWADGSELFVDLPARELDLMRRTLRIASSEDAQVLVDGSPVLTIDGATGDITSDWFEFDQSQNNVVFRPDYNATDSITSTITGVGRASFPNKIGHTGKPIGADFTPTGWVDDAGYVAGAASVASILGGYDHVVNCIAGTVCGGGHHFLRYTVGGHNIIGGGSYHVIQGVRSGIFSGRRNTINQGSGNGELAAFNVICGGDDNEITGDAGTAYAFVGAGNQNEVSADYGVIVGGISGSAAASYAFVGSGFGNTSSGAYAFVGSGNTNSAGAAYSAIITGVNNTVSATRSAIVTGEGNSVSGSHSVAWGLNNTCENTHALVTGDSAVCLGDGTWTQSAKSLAEAGDAQIITLAQAIRTTNATLTNMSGADGDLLDLPDDKVSTGTARILLVGMRDGSADANNDGDYTQVAYELTCGFYWDGTNGFLFDASVQTAVTGSPILNMTALSANTNNDFAPGAAPHLAINTGALRLKVTGIASTVINWVARIDLAITRVS